MEAAVLYAFTNGRDPENYGSYKDMEASVCMKKVLREDGGHGTERSV